MLRSVVFCALVFAFCPSLSRADLVTLWDASDYGGTGDPIELTVSRFTPAAVAFFSPPLNSTGFVPLYAPSSQTVISARQDYSLLTDPDSADFSHSWASPGGSNLIITAQVNFQVTAQSSYQTTGPLRIGDYTDFQFRGPNPSISTPGALMPSSGTLEPGRFYAYGVDLIFNPATQGSPTSASISIAAVPEPSLFFSSIALVGLPFIRRRR